MTQAPRELQLVATVHGSGNLFASEISNQVSAHHASLWPASHACKRPLHQVTGSKHFVRHIHGCHALIWHGSALLQAEKNEWGMVGTLQRLAFTSSIRVLGPSSWGRTLGLR